MVGFDGNRDDGQLWFLSLLPAVLLQVALQGQLAALPMPVTR